MGRLCGSVGQLLGSVGHYGAVTGLSGVPASYGALWGSYGALWGNCRILMVLLMVSMGFLCGTLYGLWVLSMVFGSSRWVPSSLWGFSVGSLYGLWVIPSLWVLPILWGSFYGSACGHYGVFCGVSVWVLSMVSFPVSMVLGVLHVGSSLRSPLYGFYVVILWTLCSMWVLSMSPLYGFPYGSSVWGLYGATLWSMWVLSMVFLDLPCGLLYGFHGVLFMGSSLWYSTVSMGSFLWVISMVPSIGSSQWVLSMVLSVVSLGSSLRGPFMGSSQCSSLWGPLCDFLGVLSMGSSLLSRLWGFYGVLSMVLLYGFSL